MGLRRLTGALGVVGGMVLEVSAMLDSSGAFDCELRSPLRMTPLLEGETGVGLRLAVRETAVFSGPPDLR